MIPKVDMKILIIIIIILSLIYANRYISKHRSLAQNVSGFALSHDTKHIALLDNNGLKLLRTSDGQADLQVDMPVDPKIDDRSDQLKEVRWSADDSLVTFHRKRSETQVYNIKTEHLASFTKTLGSPAWSSDGKSAAWLSTSDTHTQILEVRGIPPIKVGFTEIMVGQSDLSMAYGTVIYEDIGIDRLQWSPDNSFLVFSMPQQQRLGVISLSGQVVTYLDPLGSERSTAYYHIMDWEISPDGRKIAVGVGKRILIFDLPAGGTPVTILGANTILDLCWTSDNQNLLYITINKDKRLQSPPIGGADTYPPHDLHSISLSGTDDHIIKTEDKGMKQLTIDNAGYAYYLSGDDLYKVNLR
ncbi:MAG: hypothetical protein ACYC27_13905 [Armatimonadota bacterium]